MDVDSRLYFSIATAVIAIPTAVKVFSYASTYLCARFMHSSVLTLCFLSFLITFILGGLSGLLLSSAGLDFIFHDSYFVVGHFHTVLSLATVFGLLLAVLGLMHMVTGSSLPESHFSINVSNLLTGALFIFIPMHIDGTRGMTRRVPESPDVFLSAMTVGNLGMFTLISSVLWKLRLWSSLSTRYTHCYLDSHLHTVPINAHITPMAYLYRPPSNSSNTRNKHTETTANYVRSCPFSLPLPLLDPPTHSGYLHYEGYLGSLKNKRASVISCVTRGLLALTFALSSWSVVRLLASTL